MKLYRRLCSKLDFATITKPSVKKIISTGSTTLALSVGLFAFTSFHSKSPIDLVATDAARSASVVEPEANTSARGLSRQRKDFDKAINLLAEAASKDDQMAAYYNRLEKRLSGQATTSEKGSGVRVVKAARKAAKQATAEAAPLPSTGGVWVALKEFIGSKMIQETSASPVTESPAQPGAREASAQQVASDKVGDESFGLTVGDMAFESNPAIERWVNWYTQTQGGRRTMEIGIERSADYLEMAREEFRRAGVPEDLVWLAHVESVWHSTAMSPAAAGGIWQFIPRTATDYGLTVSSDNDERLDPVKQTRVAATYLRDLYTIFGDWALAMAAYNCGEPRVMDAVVKNGRANFWEMYDKQLLPKETCNYVPKILAAITVTRDAEDFGFITPTTAADAGR
jgi:transglycosylase-like protein with SLT domain